MPIVGGLDIHRKQITFDYWTAPGNLEALACRIWLCYQCVLLGIVVFLEFLRGNIVAGRVETFVVIPGDPFHGGEGDIPDTIPRTVPVDELFLVKTVHRFRGCAMPSN
jgi:hypothetical protein